MARWKRRKRKKVARRGEPPNDVVDVEHVDAPTAANGRLPWVQVDRRLLGEEDLQLRRTILATGSLTLAAELLGWPLSRLSERLRRKKQFGWWQTVKAARSAERRQERERRARERRRERARRPPAVSRSPSPLRSPLSCPFSRSRAALRRRR